MSYGTLQIEKMTTESGYSLGAGNASSFKNRIINGGMAVFQRNTGSAITVDGGSTYAIDRYEGAISGSARFSIQRSTDAPAGFGYSSLLTVTTTATPSGTDYNLYQQKIEGLNMQDLAWGTASAKSVMASFWIKASIAGTYSYYILSADTTMSYVVPFTVSSADTWEYKTIAITGPTTGTWVNTNANFCYTGLNLGVGSSRETATTGSWVTAASFYLGTSSTLDWISNSGATIKFTGHQLEVGTVATSFDFRSIGTELALCQRYLPAYNSVNNTLGSGSFASSTVGFATVTFPVLTRTAPTGLTASSGSALSMYANGNYASSAIAFEQAGINGAMVRVTVSGAPTGYASIVYLTGSSPQILFTGCEL